MSPAVVQNFTQIKRPVGVMVIAVVYAAMGIFALLFMGIVVAEETEGLDLGAIVGSSMTVGQSFFFGAALFLASIHLIFAWGLWRLKAWARIAVYVLSIYSLINSVFQLLSGNLNAPTILERSMSMIAVTFVVWVILYLRGRKVREAFRSASPGEPTEPTLI